MLRVAIVRQNEALGFLPWEIYKIWDAHTLILSCKTTFWLSNFWGKVFILWLNSTNLYNFYAISLLAPDAAIDIATHSLSVVFLMYFCLSIGIKAKKNITNSFSNTSESFISLICEQSEKKNNWIIYIETFSLGQKKIFFFQFQPVSKNTCYP